MNALTERENIVARLAMEGLSNKEIAREIERSPFTVKNQIQVVLVKLGARRRGAIGSKLMVT